MQTDWQETAEALMEDRYREMVYTHRVSEASRASERLPFAVRLRVFLTGRLDPADLASLRGERIQRSSANT